MNTNALKHASINDVAIVGYAFKFPGATTKEELWDILTSKKSTVSTTPKDRWEWPEYVNPETTHIGINKGGYIKDVDKFDSSFFKISPREAELMDPQQRIMLELTWELFEDAGYKPSSQKGSKTGVYFGASGSDYDLLSRAQKEDEFHKGTGTTTLGAIMPNRVSYFFDFNGPSMLIDTACSSSLVGINEAVNAIRSGECDQAIAGGINVKCHHGRSLAYFQSKMLSKDGKCYTFDEKANGFVRGEGAGVIFLKPLKKAIQDGDHIRAVIKETAVNHGGQAAGLTVPDSSKQAKLISDAYKRASIDIKSVSYIEAHGTGTGLGDPIEVAGLTMAFNQLKEKNDSFEKPWCGLGSIKTNIGHLEAASGMAGLLKIVISMENEQLPATRNFDKLNPKLSLKKSPFYIHNEMQKWSPLPGYSAVRAGVSSFGLGGANGHILLESFSNDKVIEKKAKEYLFTLSAKNKERLNDYSRSWLEYLNNNKVEDLNSICYILAVGREEFQDRLAIVFKNQDELKANLTRFLDKKKDDNMISGNVRASSNSIDFLEAQPELIKDWLIDKNLYQLGKYWCFGLTLDWSLLFEKTIKHKISMPTYPFARNRHWIEISKKEIVGENKLHPLLHRNVSDLNEQKFTSTFTGKEMFLDDHVVGTEKVLPGVAQIEMIREAGERSTHEKVTRINNLNWIRPIRVSEKPVDVSLKLIQTSTDIDFKIYSEEEGTESTYSQGKLSTAQHVTDVTYDLQQLLGRMHTTKEKATCYALLKEKELNLGESYKGISNVHYNDQEGLSEIELPKEEGFIFTPGILDSCLQSCLLWFLFREDKGLALPYSVREITLYKSLSKKMWCYSRKSASSKESDQLTKYDIDILNESGEILIAIKDFLFFPLNGLTGKVNNRDKKAVLTHEFKSTWKAALSKINATNAIENTHIYLIGGEEKLAEDLGRNQGMKVYAAPESTPKEHFDKLFGIVKKTIKENSKANFIVICPNADFYRFGFLSGLLKTVTHENNKITGKLIGLDAPTITNVDALHQLINEELSNTEKEVRYQDGQRKVKCYEAVQNASSNTPVFKDGGVYIITGGAGGLGIIFAEHISKTKGTSIVLVGRSKLNAAKAKLIAQIKGASYAQIDVSKLKDVKKFIQEVKTTHKKINGVIHGAGVIRDSFILKKTKAEITEVFAPKVQGMNNLDEATKEEDLDFMVAFSSIAAVFGNIGQSDYAAANAYLDNYAAYRESLRKAGKRKGKTVSINWPLWEEGGMQISDSSEQYLEKKWNISTLPTIDGIKGFESLINGDSTQGVIATGNRSLIEQTLNINAGIEQSKESIILEVPQIKKVDTNQLDTVIRQIRSFTSELLKMDLSTIRDDVEWGEYGFDSVVLTEFSNKLNEYYGLDINPTIFYNYPCIDELAAHLVEEYKSHLDEKVAVSEAVIQPVFTKVKMETTLKGDVFEKIKTLVSELLKLELAAVKGDIEWGEYGFDSVILTEFSNKLNDFYDLDLNPTVFYNYPTVNDLVENLLEEYSDKLKPKHLTVVSELKGADSTHLEAPVNKGRFRKSETKSVVNVEIKPEKGMATNTAEPIAIIGLNGRFPQSPDLDTFWENISKSKDLIQEIPADRWDWRKYYGDPLKDENKTKAKWGGFITDIDKFDPLFFNISPREAELMDPQQRITLESVYKALEDAGISNERIKGTDTGVFIGVASTDYSVLLNNNPLSGEAEFSTGEAHSVLANRISYLLDIHGPSEPIDTACSSALIAIHRGVENIRNGTCKMAIAGGVNAIITPQRTLSFSQAGMLSEDGRCKTFDQSANGYVRGEGVGVVILKRLSDAEADGDRIYGIVRGTAENHGGKANTLTSPNPMAQKELLMKAYRQAEIDPRDISYIEAHGTGTPLGDPIEIEGLKSAFSSLYKEHDLPKPSIAHCAIGSVKTNIGHLEAAAGIAGVLKVVYAMKNQMLPGNPNLKKQNEYLKLDNTPFYLLKETTPWTTVKSKPRIAGISSFGFGGSNAHVIIEEYTSKTPDTFVSQDVAIIVLSAKNKERLKDQAKNLLSFLRKNPMESLHNIAYTLQVGRTAMEERLSFLATTTDEMMDILSNYLEGQHHQTFQGNTKEEKSNFLLDGGAGEAYINYAIAHKESKSLAQLWVKGISVDWKLIYPNNKPVKIGLPTYPFARDRHWVSDHVIPEKTEIVGANLHPLVHVNESNFEEQKFTSNYSGKEFFLADHLVNGIKVLPGVAYLELVREAASRSTNATINQIKNITWLSPVSLPEGEKQVTINLYANDTVVDFEVHSVVEGEILTHSTGATQSVELEVLDRIVIQKILDRCSDNILRKDFYSQVVDVGVALGNSFRGIKELHFNEEEALSEIELDPKSKFILPPGILDSAIQTYVGVDMNNLGRVTGLPYRIKEVNIYKSLENISKCWAYARKRKTDTNDGTPHFDIDLLDEQGNILVRFIDLIIVSLKTNTYQNKSEEKETLSLYSSKWESASNITEVYV